MSDKAVETIIANSSMLFRTGTGNREGLGFELDQPIVVYASLFLLSDIRDNTVLIRKMSSNNFLSSHPDSSSLFQIYA